MRRTPEQREADAIDCDLYRLYTRVERAHDNATRKKEWAAALAALRTARGKVRLHMHNEDWKKTL